VTGSSQVGRPAAVSQDGLQRPARMAAPFLSRYRVTQPSHGTESPNRVMEPSHRAESSNPNTDPKWPAPVKQGAGVFIATVK
jgi:hypothetical protein